MALLKRGAVLALALLSARASPGSEVLALGGAGEYEVKAAYLYNFAKFVQWPAAAFEGPSSPFVIAVVGQDPFDGALERILAGKAVNGHPVEIRRVADPAQARGAHIAYLGMSDGSVPAALRRLPAEGTLTVGDGTSFPRRGGMIGFRIEDRRVRFDINTRRAEQAGLKMSSQLLKLARIVGDGD